MELTAFAPDKKTVVSVIVALVIICALMYVYHHFINTEPVGSITATQYGQLPAAAQANYKMNSSGYYVVNGQPMS